MPWSKNSELPAGVKNSLPDEAQTIWRKIANNALSQYSDEGKAFATAWAALRNIGWDKDKDGKWKKREIEKEQPTAGNVHVNRPLGEPEPKKYEFKIKKANDEKKLAFGWVLISRDAYGAEVFDLQDDGIDPDDLEELAYRYVKFYRDSGEMHLTAGAAVLIESVVTTMEKQEIWEIPRGVLPVGWWCGFFIKDADVWEKVKNGTYKAFSIEGSALRKEVI